MELTKHDIYVCRRIKLFVFLSPFTKIDSRRIKHLKYITLLQENLGLQLHHWWSSFMPSSSVLMCCWEVWRPSPGIPCATCPDDSKLLWEQLGTMGVVVGLTFDFLCFFLPPDWVWSYLESYKNIFSIPCKLQPLPSHPVMSPAFQPGFFWVQSVNSSHLICVMTSFISMVTSGKHTLVLLSEFPIVTIKSI